MQWWKKKKKGNQLSQAIQFLPPYDCCFLNIYIYDYWEGYDQIVPRLQWSWSFIRKKPLFFFFFTCMLLCRPHGIQIICISSIISHKKKTRKQYTFFHLPKTCQNHIQQNSARRKFLSPYTSNNLSTFSSIFFNNL